MLSVLKTASIVQEDTMKLTKDEFEEKYCINCGSQRCEGIGTDWFYGCQHKDKLTDKELPQFKKRKR